MVTSSILSFRSTKIVAQKSGHVNVFSMYFQIRYSSSVKSSKKREKSCGTGILWNHQIMMKTELKLVENQSGFRKYGICCKFGFIRTICAERGKSYANMSYYFQIHLRHLLAPFPRLRPLIPLSVALLRCVSFALASAKNSLRILAHSHLEIVSRERTQTSSVFIAHLSPTQRRTPVQKHNFVEKAYWQIPSWGI